MQKKNTILKYLLHDKYASYYVSNFLPKALWSGHFSFKGKETDVQRDKITCFTSPSQIIAEREYGPKITLASVYSILTFQALNVESVVN